MQQVKSIAYPGTKREKMKKTTLMMIASATMLLAAPATETNMTTQGRGMGMGAKMGQGQGMHGKKMMQRKGMAKKAMHSPFLIKHGLPHLTKMIMPYMNDPDFALTAEQKGQLAKVRKETMGAIMKIKPEVISLRKEIVSSSTSRKSAASLKEKVEKLASLEAEATMAHLKCIEETKAILSKDQLLYMLSHQNKGMMHGKRMMRHGKGMMKRVQ